MQLLKKIDIIIITKFLMSTTAFLFDETTFVSNIIEEYYASDMIDSCINTFDKYFNIVIETYDNKELLESYCTINEIENAKHQYGANYIITKLHLVLFIIVVNSIMNNEYSEANTDIEYEDN
jgi:hypothetical protein